jgi:acyl carrier protein
MSRLDGAILAVREAVAAASTISVDAIEPDEDLLDDLGLDNLELISLALILEEVFSIEVPEAIFETALYRTSASLAEWCIRQSEEASWTETRRQRRRA